MCEIPTEADNLTSDVVLAVDTDLVADFAPDPEDIVPLNKVKKPRKTRKDYYKPELAHKNYRNFYEKYNDKVMEKTKCECGGSYTYFNKSNHMKSFKHSRFKDSKNALSTDRKTILEKLEVIDALKIFLEANLEKLNV